MPIEQNLDSCPSVRNRNDEANANNPYTPSTRMQADPCVCPKGFLMVRLYVVCTVCTPALQHCPQQEPHPRTPAGIWEGLSPAALYTTYLRNTVI